MDSRRDEMARDRNPLATVPWRMYLIIGSVGLIIVALTGYGFYTGVQMSSTYAPLVDAAMEIKIEATSAHLWFEEFLSGDPYVDIKVTWKHLDRADWYAQAMLEGGKNPEGTFIHLDDVEMRREIREVQEKLAEFRAIAQQRIAEKETSGIGSDIDQQYDAIFLTLIEQADEVEIKLQQLMARDLDNFRATQVILIIICSSLSLFIGIVFHRFERRQTQSLLAVSAANESLKVEIAERVRAESHRDATLETLRENEKLLRKVAENYPNSYISIIEQDYTIGFTSGQEFKKQNLDPEQFLGLTLEQVFGDQAAIIRQNCEKTFKGKERSFKLFINDQHQLYHTVPLYSDDGSIPRILAVVENITERVRTEAAIQRQLEELTILHAVVSIGVEAANEETLVERTAEIVGKIFYPNDFSVLLLDQAAGVLRTHPPQRPGTGIKETSIPLGQGITGLVVMDGQPRRIADVTREPKYLKINPATRSELCVPLKAGEQIIGVVNVESTRPDTFSEADERLLITFAGQLATAIARMRLMETLEQRVSDRTRELQALYRVTAIASESLDIDAVLGEALKRSLAATMCQAGAIQLLKKDNGMRLAAQQGLPSHVELVVEGNGLSDWVIEHGKPLLVPDMSSNPRAPRETRPSAALPYLGVPMRAEGKTVGVLSVVGEAGQHFGAEDVALLASIADHVAVAVENAQLRQQARRTAVVEERGRLARELHDSVTQLLYSLSLFAETGQRLAVAGELSGASDYLGRIGETSQQALKEMRVLVYELRPPALEQVGLVGALQQRLDAVEKRAGVEASLLVKGTLKLPPKVEAELYHISQEALNNALKHAAAATVQVYIHAHDDQVKLQVADDGIGFDPSAASDSGGLGLISMRERAKKLGAKLDILSAPDKGTKVKIVVSG